MKHIIGVDDFYPQMLDELVERARVYKDFRLIRRPQAPNHIWPEAWSGRLMITDFFEPSTRTRLSFEAAMTYLGGHVIGTENAAEFSSFKKGESLEDNFKVISGYCDVIVGRFINEGDARRASLACDVPLINGGDGQGEHPTQALIDYFSISEKFDFHRGEEIRIAFIGDNLRSRTVQSLARLLAPYDGVKKIRFISPGYLKASNELIADITLRTVRPEQKIVENYSFVDGIENALIRDSNIIYMTRSQDERGGVAVTNTGLVFLPRYLDLLPEKALILHPLPRNSELPVEIDKDPRAYYFEQAKNGLYVRMALLEWLFKHGARR